MSDYIPPSDSNYDDWLSLFTTFITNSGTSLGLTPAQIAAMQTAQEDWHNAFMAKINFTNNAKAATQTKDMERRESEYMARQLVRIIQASPYLSDAQRVLAGITVPDQIATSSSPELIETTAAPLILLDWSQRCTMIIHYGKNPANERRNALPTGMKGCRIFYALNGMPQNEEGWIYLADHTRSPFIHVMPVTVPTTLAYRVQYFDRRYRLGVFGPAAVGTIVP